MLLVRFYVSEIIYDQEIVLFLFPTGFVTIFHIYIVGLYSFKVERLLIMTTATLFKAAESKSQCTQRYGAVVN